MDTMEIQAMEPKRVSEDPYAGKCIARGHEERWERTMEIYPQGRTPFGG